MARYGSRGRLATKVSIANDFMYAGNLTSCRKKDAYVSGLIRSILEFQPDVLFVDTNYLPSASTLNDRDLALIKQQTSVPIFGHSGDLLDERDSIAHVFGYQRLTCCFTRTFRLPTMDWKGWNICLIPVPGPDILQPNERVPLFFSGIGNISRFWYLLSAKRFAIRFLPNSMINFLVQQTIRLKCSSLRRNMILLLGGRWQFWILLIAPGKFKTPQAACFKRLHRSHLLSAKNVMR